MKTMSKNISAFVLSLSMLGFQAINPNYSQDHGAKIKISQESFDFGEVQEGSVVNHIFRVTNVGDSVLNIYKLRGS